METIVVGVDGSEGGRAALEFAAAEAALRRAQLRLVSAWEIPPAVYGAGFAPPLDSGTLDSFRKAAQGVADEAEASAKKLQPGLEVESDAVQGGPAEVLVDEAGKASMIVVGNRGLGGFKSLLLGSVSQQVVHHAPCPVVVVRAPSGT